MAVDPLMAKKVLVVHGVQAGEDEDQNQHKDIKQLVETRLNGAPLEFDTEMYRYENINDKAQRLLRTVLKLFVTNIIAQKAVDLTADVVGDVVIALHDGSTAYTIRQGLVDRILEIYEEGNPLYVVAHSLGTIYAFDAVEAAVGSDQLVDRVERVERSTRSTRSTS